MTKAWMLRIDGKAFPCTQHLYVMDDDDLSSAAEVASFIIKSESKGTVYAKMILDFWMALLIEDSVDYNAEKEDIDEAIKNALTHLPYTFPYRLSTEEYIKIHNERNKYNDVDSLYYSCDEARENINIFNDEMKKILNSQFCRVRFGGQYNSYISNNTIWFRISSQGINWSNIIYQFVADMKAKLKITGVTICRDYESDNGEVEGKAEYLYKAKNGEVYYDMPVEEFLSGENDSNPVFASKAYLRNFTVEDERRKLCINASEYFDNLPNRTKNKLGKVKQMIVEKFPEITEVEIDGDLIPNRSGNLVGFELRFILSSFYSVIDGLNVTIKSSKSISDVLDSSIFRMFAREYVDYLKFNNIEFKR